ncbi:hypothetical protein MESS4_360154 [Mesorhizobium sp. STM 4661]|nr:hypothetical protein MESS4_360154 [Mesorhizobium sp. STM 4661]
MGSQRGRLSQDRPRLPDPKEQGQWGEAQEAADGVEIARRRRVRAPILQVGKAAPLRSTQ